MDVGPPLRDIGCFALVAERLSFSRAATELGMSQPAVSQAIARLERTLGLRLFERTSREVQLTDAGKLLLPQAEELLAQATTFSNEAARLSATTEQTIRLAYCPLVGTLAARVARLVTSRAPHVDLELRPAGWGTATADLVQGIVSAAFMSTPFPPMLPVTGRFHLPITHLAVPSGSPIATVSRVRLEQLAREEVLLPRTRPRGSVWSHLAARLPAANRTSAGPADLDDLPAALDLVAAGKGLLAAPTLLVETTRRPDIQFVPLDGAELRLTYALVWRPDHATANVTTLVQAAQDLLRAPQTRAP